MPPSEVGDAASQLSAPLAPPSVVHQRLHPLDRPDDEPRDAESEVARIRLAWAKLVWLLSFLAVLLAISYLVPYIAEQTQYAITRGKQRAEYELAQVHLGKSPLQELSRAYQMVSQVVGPSVVHISTVGVERDVFPLSTGRRTRVPSEGQGSGIIVDAGGYILTNYHVIRGSDDISVALSDGRKVKAQIIGYDRPTDIALLKIAADKLVPAKWGDSEQVEPGALVWAVGSPFGLERTITAGILSAKHRAGLAGSLYQDFLQTDAAVNPGNSGGPLVNSSGEVIGINTAIVGDAYQGISFAIPSNVAREVFERLKADGLVRRGWLGVELAELTPDRASAAGVAEGVGVFIAGIFQQAGGSPAARAGIEAGDIIVQWNGTPVKSADQLKLLVAKTEVGSRATVVVYRNGQPLSLEVVVGQRPPLD